MAIFFFVLQVLCVLYVWFIVLPLVRPVARVAKRGARFAALCWLAILVIFAQPLPEVRAQQLPAPSTTIPADELNRGTPRRAVRGFMQSFESGDYSTAAEYLDLSDLPPAYRNIRPSGLARQLGIVFSREVWIDAGVLSDAPEGATDDNLPADQDRLAVISAESGDIVLRLQRVELDSGVLVWKIAGSTVARTAELYAEFGYGPVVEFLARNLPRVSILGVELFKWVFVLGSGLIAYALLALLAPVVAPMLVRTRALPQERALRYLRGPVALVLAILVANAVLFELGLGIAARGYAAGHTVPIVAVTWLILATLNVVRDGVVASLRQQHRDAAVVIQRPIFGAMKIVVVITACVTWLDNVGYNITTLLASLGVGGIAMALALQKPLEDVFAAFTLYNQQPVRIGDFCRFGDKLGMIEEIGLRTTRIRTLSNTRISVPNAKIASEYLENLSDRSTILFNPILRIRIDTTPDTVQRVLDDLRAMLAEHEKVAPTGLRVRFVRIGPDALELEIFAYLNAAMWSEYLEICEDLNLKILGVVAAAGASLALPAQDLVVDVKK